MVKTEFAFGEKVLITGEIQRYRGALDKDGNIIPSGSHRFWHRIEHEARPALFLNGVNLANGDASWETYGYQGEDGASWEFSPTELIKGAWICEYNRAPRKVFLSDIHKITSPST